MSFSKLSTYQTCAYKYKLIYINGQPGKPSPHLSFGTIMHNTFYEFESIPAGAKREYADLERIFEKNWDGEIGSYRRKWGRSLYEVAAAEKNTPADDLERQAREDGILMLKNYWRESQTNPNKVRGVEKWLGGEIGHYHVTGRLDRLDQRPDGAYEIIDYKTGQRIYTEDTLKDSSRGYGLQAGLYYEMCREAWRGRVDRFVFKYLQKRQSLTEHLMTQWMDRVRDAARLALGAGAAGAQTPDAADLAKTLAEEADRAIREKLPDKLTKKVIAEFRENRVRDATKKISLDEEEEMLTSLPEPERRRGRLFLKTLNKTIEQKINEDIAPRSIRDAAPQATDDVQAVIREVLKGYDGGRTAAAVSAFLAGIAGEFSARMRAVNWPELAGSERDRITDELMEILHRREIKDRTANFFRTADAGELAKKLSKDIEAISEIRSDRRVELVRHVVSKLASSFTQQLDVYPADEIARLVSESAPDGFLTDDHTRRADATLDDLVKRSGVTDKQSGRTLTADAIALARKKTLLQPLTKAVTLVVHACVESVISDMLAERSDVLTPQLRESYRKFLAALGDPAVARAAAQKMAAAMARGLFHDIYFKQGVVPVVEHVTRLFDRPEVMKIMAKLQPDLSEPDRRKHAQRLIEKLDWRDVEYLLDEALGPGFAAWQTLILDLAMPAAQSAVSAASTPESLDGILRDAETLFEGRLIRVTTVDVNVPYTPQTRDNVIRAIEAVENGIRRNDFTPAPGALCGWCEYQAGCPAWCKYRDMCKDVCKDEYNCRKWFDEKTGKLVEGKPAGMTHEEYLRRVAEKFEVTDRSLFRLSFSKMNTYEMCPMNYRKLYLDHVAPKPKSFFSIGLSYHQTMEDLYAYTGPKKQPSLKKLLDLFKRKWISAGYRSREEEDFNFRRGLRMCEDYYAEFIDGKYKPAGAAEDYFEFRVGRTLLCGFIDRVDLNEDGTITIIDYKTNPKLYTQEELDEDQQMTMYYLAAREGKISSTNYKPVDVKKFVFQFVNFCKDLVTYRKPSDLEALTERVTHFTAEMEWRQKLYKNSNFDPRAGMLLFPPQDNKYCQSCDHHHLCPLKTDMTWVTEIQSKGVQYEDGTDANEFSEGETERLAKVDSE